MKQLVLTSLQLTLQNCNSPRYTFFLPYSQHGVNDVLADLDLQVIRERLKQRFLFANTFIEDQTWGNIDGKT